MRVVTIRMDDAFHAQLREAAHDRYVSMNSLCLLALQEYLTKPKTTRSPRRAKSRQLPPRIFNEE